MSALMKDGGSGMESGLVVLRELVQEPAGARKATRVARRSGSTSDSSRMRVVSKNIAEIVDNQ